MTELEKKLDMAIDLYSELKVANQNVMMKNGQLNDLMQDIAVTHLGYDKELKEFPLPELLKKAYLQAKK